MARAKKAAKPAKVDDAEKVDPKLAVAEAPQVTALSTVKVVEIRDADENVLELGHMVSFSGKVVALNDPTGVTVRVGSEKDTFVDIALPAKLVAKE